MTANKTNNLKAYMANYYLEHKEQHDAYNKKYIKEHPEEIKLNNKKWRDAHKPEILERRRQKIEAQREYWKNWYYKHRCKRPIDRVPFSILQYPELNQSPEERPLEEPNIGSLPQLQLIDIDKYKTSKL